MTTASQQVRVPTWREIVGSSLLIEYELKFDVNFSQRKHIFPILLPYHIHIYLCMPASKVLENNKTCVRNHIFFLYNAPFLTSSSHFMTQKGEKMRYKIMLKLAIFLYDPLRFFPSHLSHFCFYQILLNYFFDSLNLNLKISLKVIFKSQSNKNKFNRVESFFIINSILIQLVNLTLLREV